jgi:hypothetical protein
MSFRAPISLSRTPSHEPGFCSLPEAWTRPAPAKVRWPAVRLFRTLCR